MKNIQMGRQTYMMPQIDESYKDFKCWVIENLKAYYMLITMCLTYKLLLKYFINIKNVDWTYS